MPRPDAAGMQLAPAPGPRGAVHESIDRSLRILRTRHWSFNIGCALFLLILAVLVLAPWITPYDPNAQELVKRLSPVSSEHWLGTDQLGRDTFSRLLFGGRFSVTVAAVIIAISVVVGTILGVISARAGGIVDEVTMRTVDLLIAFPDVLVALFLIAIVGPGHVALISALTLVAWTPFARMARSLTLEINSRDFITAAEVLGCTRSFIIFRHVIPNAYRPIAAITFLRFGHKLITVGALSFLGLGVQPPNSDWGAMLADALRFVERAPMLAFAPGFAIFITALSVTLIGQGLEIEAKPRGAGGDSPGDARPPDPARDVAKP
ncbi:MAG: ABC transporter permease [Rhodobacteraceae bacterium]|nr:ABC transporter permease [Paracoccaceae bacterium]MCY4137943.1 ABC transporter permease [Paracoccaceae bacterium]